MHMYCFLTLRVHLDQWQVIFFFFFDPGYFVISSHIQMSKRLRACASGSPSMHRGSRELKLEALALVLSQPWHCCFPLHFQEYSVSSVLLPAEGWRVAGFVVLGFSWHGCRLGFLFFLCFWVRLHLSRIVSLAFRLFSFFPSSIGMFTSKISLFSSNH